MIALVDPRMRSPGRKPHDRTSDAGHAAAGSPLVSIGLPVYNGERFLGEALDSLVGQTYRNLEILVGDNASTDGTEAICREYAGRDPRIRYLRSDVNRGAAWNFNRLVHEATGKYFRWAAADDAVGPECVESCVEILETYPDFVLAYPMTRLIDGEGETIRDYDDGLHLAQDRPSGRFRRLHQRIGYCNAAYGVIRRSALCSSRLLGAYPGSDIVLLGELALEGKFFELDRRLFLRRFHSEAASSKNESSLEHHYRATSPDQPLRGVLPALYLREWRHLAANLRVALTARVGPGEKSRIVWFLLRRAARNRDEMARQLLDAMKYRRERWKHARGARRSQRREGTST